MQQYGLCAYSIFLVQGGAKENMNWWYNQQYGLCALGAFSSLRLMPEIEEER
jgi:hypothetical protein